METVRNSRNGEAHHGQRIWGATEGGKETLIEIVGRARDGDEAALAELVERFRSRLENWVRRHVRNEADVSDICQEVWILVWQKIGTLQDPACFPGWLYKMSHNLACRRAAREGRHRKHFRSETDLSGGKWQEDDDSCLGQAPSRENPPPDKLIRDEQADEVQDCVKRLCTLDRQSLQDQYMDGLSLEEASQRRGVPEGTTKRRWHVARQRFGAKWERMHRQEKIPA